jgi:hypothetical protein
MNRHATYLFRTFSIASESVINTSIATLRHVAFAVSRTCKFLVLDAIACSSGARASDVGKPSLLHLVCACLELDLAAIKTHKVCPHLHHLLNSTPASPANHLLPQSPHIVCPPKTTATMTLYYSLVRPRSSSLPQRHQLTMTVHRSFFSSSPRC